MMRKIRELAFRLKLIETVTDMSKVETLISAYEPRHAGRSCPDDIAGCSIKHASAA